MTGTPQAIKGKAKSFEIWKTITLGTYPTKEALISALIEQGMKISERVSAQFRHPAFMLATEQTELDLIMLSTADLELANEAAYSQICARAKEFGLELCSGEVGLQLRLQYGDQPKDGQLIIVITDIHLFDGRRYGFYLSHDEEELWLGGIYGDPGYTRDDDNRFVFVLPRK